MFGAAPTVAAATSVAFVAPAALEDGLAERLDVRRRLAPTADVRRRGKADLPHNDALPDIHVDPETFTVAVDGEEVVPEPATELPWPSATSCSDRARSRPWCHLGCGRLAA